METRRGRERVSPWPSSTLCKIVMTTYIFLSSISPQSLTVKALPPGSMDVSSEQGLHFARGWVLLQWVKKPQSWWLNLITGTTTPGYWIWEESDFCPGLTQLCPRWRARGGTLLTQSADANKYHNSGSNFNKALLASTALLNSSLFFFFKAVLKVNCWASKKKEKKKNWVGQLFMPRLNWVKSWNPDFGPDSAVPIDLHRNVACTGKVLPELMLCVHREKRVWISRFDPAGSKQDGSAAGWQEETGFAPGDNGCVIIYVREEPLNAFLVWLRYSSCQSNFLIYPKDLSWHLQDQMPYEWVLACIYRGHGQAARASWQLPAIQQHLVWVKPL